ncbi:hypothetical protein P7C70_g2932, partial [Phenoliferia sp. Uapishka_3]
MGSRDRLAQIRAQQSLRTANGPSPYDHDSQPMQQRGYEEREPPPMQQRDDYGVGRPPPFAMNDPYSMSQPIQRSWSNEQPRDRRPTDDYASPSRRRSSSQPRGLPTGGPRPNGRRPSMAPPLPPSDQHRPDYRVARNVEGRDGSAYQEREPPRDFDPNSFGGGAPPSGARSQYAPAPPRVTRQRSISGGQRVSLEDYRPRETSGAPPHGQGYSQPHGPVPTIYSEESREVYGYSEKGSTVNLVAPRGGEFEMQQRPGPGRGQQDGSDHKGRPTIRMGDVPREEMGEFFEEVSDLQTALREAAGVIQKIQDLHLRILSMPSSDDPQAVALTQALTETTATTRASFTSIKGRITELEQGNANLRALIAVEQSQYNLTPADVDVREVQVVALKERFKGSIQRYAEVERESRAKNRTRMERQVKILNPNLNSGEITDVVRQAEGGANLFSQALLQSNGQRSYAARGALREAESRAAELSRIEQTLIELAQIFNDMANLVEAQDVQIIAIEQTAATVQKDVEKGLVDTKKAVVSARSARKMRWWCFGVFMVILVVVAIIVVFEVVLPIIRKNNKSK